MRDLHQATPWGVSANGPVNGAGGAREGSRCALLILLLTKVLNV